MIVGKGNIIKWFEDSKVPYWALYYKAKVDAGNPIHRSNKDSNATAADALQELRDTLDLIARGQYTLIAHENEKTSTRGGLRVDFEIPANEDKTNPSTPALSSIGGMPQSIGELDQMTEARAQRLISEFKLQMQLQQLQTENAELKKENVLLEKEATKGSNRFWDAVNGIGVDKILGAFIQPQRAPAVAGIPDTAEPPENDTEYSIRLGRVIEIFQANDPDWLETLESMANKIQADPAIIKMFKKFL